MTAKKKIINAITLFFFAFFVKYYKNSDLKKN